MSLPEDFPKVNEQHSAKILTVCLGNICRSPTLEIVLRVFAKNRKLNIIVDSCGTANYHAGENPHPPSIKHAKGRGYDMSKLISRQITKNDFQEYDLILAADKSNYRNIMALCPKDKAHKVMMATSFLPKKSKFFGADMVPDPWGGDAEDYEHVLDLSEDIMENLCDVIEKNSL